MSEWVMVPVEPTEEMIIAGSKPVPGTSWIVLSGESVRARYRAMLSARPAAPPGEGMGTTERLLAALKEIATYAITDDNHFSDLALGHIRETARAAIEGTWEPATDAPEKIARLFEDMAERHPEWMAQEIADLIRLVRIIKG